MLILQILLLKRWPLALLWVRYGGWQRDHVKIHGQCSSWLKVQFRRGLCKPQASVTVKYKSKICLLHPPLLFLQAYCYVFSTSQGAETFVSLM